MKFEMLMHPTGLIKAMSVFTQHIKRIRLRAYLFHILFYGTGIWVWEPDHQPATYFNWRKGEPNGGSEHFAHILDGARLWNDLDGSNTLYPTYALCQINP